MEESQFIHMAVSGGIVMFIREPVAVIAEFGLLIWIFAPLFRW